MNAYSARRMAQATELMKQKDLDCLIYATGANFQYLLDWNEFLWQRTCMNNIGGQSSALNAPDALLILDKTGEYHVIMTPVSAAKAPKDARIALS